LPEPDSPTIATVSRAFSASEMFCTASVRRGGRNMPCLVMKVLLSPVASRIGSPEILRSVALSERPPGTAAIRLLV